MRKVWQKDRLQACGGIKNVKSENRLIHFCLFTSCWKSAPDDHAKKKAMGVFGIKLIKMSVQLVEIPEANSWGQCKGYIKTNTNLNAELNISYTILLLRQYNQSQLCHFLLCGSILWKRWGIIGHCFLVHREIESMLSSEWGISTSSKEDVTDSCSGSQAHQNIKFPALTISLCMMNVSYGLHG